MVKSKQETATHDPISTECQQCGNRQFNDRIGPQPRCSECSAFMSFATEEQVRLFYARQVEQIRQDEGYVAVA